MRFTKFAVSAALIALGGTPALASAHVSKARHSGRDAHAHKAGKAGAHETARHHRHAERAVEHASAASKQPHADVAAALAAPAFGLDAPAVKADLAMLSGGDETLHAAPSVTAAPAPNGASDKAAVRAAAVAAKKKGDAARGTAAEDPQFVAKSGTVSSKGMRSLAQAGVPQTVLSQVATAFKQDSSLHGALPEHSEFHVVYEEIVNAKTHRKHPELRMAALNVAGKEHRVYGYPVEHDTLAFVDGSGHGVMPFDLAPPVPGAPITSPFGWRIHPILEVRRFHEGVDFGAPTGTPVRAAEDGVIEDVGFRGNYGNYVRVRHTDRLETAYAHLNGFAPGLHAGSQVHRGQVIAYIGTTGWATGPHLYYEVMVDGEHLDPLRHDLALKVHFEGAALRRFKQFTDQVASHSRAAAADKSSCLLPVCKTNPGLG